MDAPTRFYNGFYALLKVADNLLVDSFECNKGWLMKFMRRRRRGITLLYLKRKRDEPRRLVFSKLFLLHQVKLYPAEPAIFQMVKGGTLGIIYASFLSGAKIIGVLQAMPLDKELGSDPVIIE
jgi:hypothetical protein